MKKTIVTCALPYINNVPHIGNITGSHLPSDIYVRALRLNGKSVLFIGGSDEHGTPILVTSNELKLTPKQVTDKLYEIHKNIYDWLNISYDNFSRTTRKIHHKTTVNFYENIDKNNYLTEKVEKLPYCNKCVRTLPDRYVEGICPNCEKKARGDQCDYCTKLLTPNQLKNLICKNCEIFPVFKNQKHLFLNLEKLSPKIKNWINLKKDWKKQVKKIAISWIEEGLKSRSITRDLNWGIKVPRKGFENKVFYVWFDAPIGYISSTKEIRKDWEMFWKKKHSPRIIHFVGKDNIPFHTVWWGGMLISEGSYALPELIAGLQYTNYEGDKISKSNNWGVFCENFEKLSLKPDQWRYYLTKIIPETKDTYFTWDEFNNSLNSELIGNIANLTHRVLSFAYVLNKGVKKTSLETAEKKLLKKSEDYCKKTVENILKLNFKEGLKICLQNSSLANKYFQDQTPWNKEEKEKEKIVYTSCVILKNLWISLHPYLPETSETILKILKTKPLVSELKKELKSFKLIKKPSPLFKKLDEKDLKHIKEITTKPTPLTKYFKNSKTVNKAKDMISYNDFSKLDLITAEVLSVEPVDNTDKLYKIILNDGEKKRQIVSGLREDYPEPSELVGKTIIIIANLEPRKIRGELSEGMLLAINEEGKANLLTSDKKTKPGLKIT